MSLEQEPQQTEGVSEVTPERRDRFMELMESRHRNARIILQVEKILSSELPPDERLSSRTFENQKAKEDALEALDSILAQLIEDGYGFRSNRVIDMVDSYFDKKIEAQREELKIKESLLKEGKDPSPYEVGLKLFRDRTGKDPVGKVLAKRQEGYFVFEFSNNDDYSEFSGIKKNDSFGCFSQQIENIPTDVILCTKEHTSLNLLLHERQHFINNSVLGFFSDLEDTKILQKRSFPNLTKDTELVDEQTTRKGLAKVKDEVIARIRDDSDAFRATKFFDSDTYSYLRKNLSEEEQKEVSVLLGEILVELNGLFKLCEDLHVLENRGILVYHLIDIPLIKFPERIKAIVKFYRAKTEKLRLLIPVQNWFKYEINEEDKNRLRDLTDELLSNHKYASKLLFENIDLSYDEVEKRLQKLEEEGIKLREEYNTLLESQPNSQLFLNDEFSRKKHAAERGLHEDATWSEINTFDAKNERRRSF